MLGILEEVLPRRFGGSPLDYQLVEEEDERGIARLHVVVSPAVGPVDETAVVRTVLDLLAQGDSNALLAASFWDQAGGLRVRRAPPFVTRQGKFLPLWAVKSGERHPHPFGAGSAAADGDAPRAASRQ
jgi:hypothetical protein